MRERAAGTMIGIIKKQILNAKKNLDNTADGEGVSTKGPGMPGGTTTAPALPRACLSAVGSKQSHRKERS